MRTERVLITNINDKKAGLKLYADLLKTGFKTGVIDSHCGRDSELWINCKTDWQGQITFAGGGVAAQYHYNWDARFDFEKDVDKINAFFFPAKKEYYLKPVSISFGGDRAVGAAIMAILARAGAVPGNSIGDLVDNAVNTHGDKALLEVYKEDGKVFFSSPSYSFAEHGDDIARFSASNDFGALIAFLSTPPVVGIMVKSTDGKEYPVQFNESNYITVNGRNIKLVTIASLNSRTNEGEGYERVVSVTIGDFIFTKETLNAIIAKSKYGIPTK